MAAIKTKKTSTAKVIGHPAPGILAISIGDKEAIASIPMNALSKPDEGSEIEVEEHERHGFIHNPKR